MKMEAVDGYQPQDVAANDGRLVQPSVTNGDAFFKIIKTASDRKI